MINPMQYWSIYSYLHTWTLHSIYTIPYIPHPDPAFSHKLKFGSEKCSRTPNACPSLVCTFRQYNYDVSFFEFTRIDMILLRLIYAVN